MLSQLELAVYSWAFNHAPRLISRKPMFYLYQTNWEVLLTDNPNILR